MTNSNNNLELKTNKRDLGVTTLKSLLNFIPVVGGPVAEFVGEVIPQQRVDRVVQFVEKLNERLSDVEKDNLVHKLANENFRDLMEEAITKEATRAVSKERKEYIAALIKNSLKSDDTKHIHEKYLLNLLGQINDIEVILLRYHGYRYFNGDEEFRKKHNDVIRGDITTWGASQDQRDSAALIKNYKEHMAKLGLLLAQYETQEILKIDPSISGYKVLKIDEFTQSFKISGYQITDLGKLLLRYIDLTPTEKPPTPQPNPPVADHGDEAE